MYEETTTTYYTTRADFRPQYETVSFSTGFDADYVRTLPGMLKVIVIIFNFLCFFFVLIGGPGYYAGVGWATFVSVFGFVISLTLLILYLFHIVDNFENIPWIVGVSYYLLLFDYFLEIKNNYISFLCVLIFYCLCHCFN